MKQVVFLIALLFITANAFAQHEMPSVLTDYEELLTQNLMTVRKHGIIRCPPPFN